MVIGIHQPQFMPWLGYFDKMDRCDVFVLLDNVQYKKNEYQNRNRIKTPRGRQWLTVPVHYKFPQKICEVAICDDGDWRKKNLRSLEMNYRKSPHFESYIGPVRALYGRQWRTLSELNIACVRLLAEILGIGAAILPASEMGELSEEPSERLIGICRRLGSDTYLAGRDGARYMDLGRFREAGIRVAFQDFRHPVYPQMFGGFEYFMSAIDMIFNCGEGSIEIIRKENGR